MRAYLDIDEANKIRAIKIIPEAPADLSAFQKVKLDSDRKIEVIVKDHSKFSELISVKITIEFSPAYL